MKVAVVTGGSNGIGKSTAIELGRRGIGVILTYHSDKKGADEAIREIEQKKAVRAVALKLDLSQKSTFEDFAQQVKKNLEEVWQRNTFDYLINNGGTGGPMMFADMTEDYFDKMLNTNFKGPFFLTQEMVTLMEDGGRSLNTSIASSSTAPAG